MILITGAGGKTGRALVNELSKAESLRVFVHREKQVPVLKSLGAGKVVVGDLRDTLIIQQAMEDVRAIYHICPNMSPDEVEIGRSMINEAKRASVEHFVYHSVLHPQTERMNHHWQKMRVEEMIFESGLPFTILQPAPYLQNLLAYWKSILEDGVLRIPYSVDAAFSFVDLDDIAEAARIVFADLSHKNAVYELAGMYPMTHVQVAKVISRVLNQDIRAEKEEIADWRSRVPGMSEYAVENLIRMFDYYDRWGLSGNPKVLRWLLRREPTSLEMFVDRTVKEDHAND